MLITTCTLCGYERLHSGHCTNENCRNAYDFPNPKAIPPGFTVVAVTPGGVQRLTTNPRFSSKEEAEADAKRRNDEMKERNRKCDPAFIMPIWYEAVDA